VIANVELAYQSNEKDMRAAELVVANVELAHQSDEKAKRAAELVVANVELAYQSNEKEMRAAELVVANVELAHQSDEKAKRAAELVIANVELAKNMELSEVVWKLAFYDALTNLPNRRLLNDRLTQAMAASKRSLCNVALMMMDLDNFKPLNDTHGHAVGDFLLVEVGRRLIACVREVDTVARFGGDEFVAILSELDNDKALAMAQARGVAEKIRISLAEPYQLKVTQLGRGDTMVVHRCSVSIGVVVFVNHELNQTDIMKCADAAMYQAKKMGRNSVQCHEVEC
jgi:diguanylate cyclase (GGDEF)-like protein